MLLIFTLFQLKQEKNIKTNDDTYDRYSVVFDCGNSGTKVHVFGLYENNVKIPKEITCDKTSRSDIKLPMVFVSDKYLSKIFDTLTPYVQALIPDQYRSKSDVFVIGTEGMRALLENEAQTVYNRTRDYLAQHQYWKQFQYHNDSFRSLIGYQEGIYAWFAANYVDQDFSQTYAIAEIGSGSAQVVFLNSDKANKKYIHEITFSDKTYKVFANSFPKLGIDNALSNLSLSLAASSGKTIIDLPCFPRNYETTVSDIDIKGTGSYDECVKLLKNRTLLTGDCSSDKCIFDGVPFPSEGIGKLIGISVFYYPIEFFNSHPDKIEVEWPTEQSEQTIANIEKFGQKFCSYDWETLKSKYGISTKEDEDKFRNYCLQLVYSNTFLKEGLHYSDDSQDVMRINELSGTTISWAYGVILARASNDFVLDDNKSRNVTIAVVVGVIVGLIVIAVIVVIIIKCRKHNQEDDDFAIDNEEEPPKKDNDKETDQIQYSQLIVSE